jgi:hypothetical protein
LGATFGAKSALAREGHCNIKHLRSNACLRPWSDFSTLAACPCPSPESGHSHPSKSGL